MRPEQITSRPDADALDHGFLADVADGQVRLTPEQALELLTKAPLHTLGRYADRRCRSLHGDTIRTYVIDRNINYTNVCSAREKTSGCFRDWRLKMLQVVSAGILSRV